MCKASAEINKEMICLYKLGSEIFMISKTLQFLIAVIDFFLLTGILDGEILHQPLNDVRAWCQEKDVRRKREDTELYQFSLIQVKIPRKQPQGLTTAGVELPSPGRR